MATKKGKPKKTKSTIDSPPTTNIIGNTFNAFKWDEKAVDVIDTIASGLESNAEALGENAKGLTKIIDLFKNQNVTLDTILNVDNDGKTTIANNAFLDNKI